MQFSAPVFNPPVAVHGFADNNVFTPSLVVPDLMRDQIRWALQGNPAYDPSMFAICINDDATAIASDASISGANLRPVSFFIGVNGGNMNPGSPLVGTWRNVGHDVPSGEVGLFMRRF